MKQLVVYYVPTYMPVSKLTYKRHKNQISKRLRDAIL